MKIKIGVIGSKATADLIMDVSMEYEEQAEFKTYVYTRVEQLHELFFQSEREMDVMLFTSEAPYSYVAKSREFNKPALYIPRTGTCFYRTLWEIRDQGIQPKRISSDANLHETVLEASSELGLEIEESIEIENTFEKSYEEVVTFHMRLWQKGMIDAAITGYSKVYETLKSSGMPISRLYPTRTLIREYINNAIKSGEIKRSMDAQIAVQVIKVRSNVERDSSRYGFMRLKNEFESVLIDYTSEIFGSLFPLGRDEYLVFSNRGSFEDINHIVELQNMLTDDVSKKLIISSGVGFGFTVYDAEKNARTSLKHALQKEIMSVYVADEYGTISGPFSSNEDFVLTYALDSDNDEEIREIARKASLSSVYVAKMKSMISTLNRDKVDANDVSDTLGISIRSARRILIQLEKSGYADFNHSESSSVTGRPRKVYKVKL